MDISGINVALDALNLTDAKSALIDLIELNRVEEQQLYSMGWAGMDKLGAYAAQASIDPLLQSVLGDSLQAANDAVFEIRKAG